MLQHISLRFNKVETWKHAIKCSMKEEKILIMWPNLKFLIKIGNSENIVSDVELIAHKNKQCFMNKSENESKSKNEHTSNQ